MTRIFVFVLVCGWMTGKAQDQSYEQFVKDSLELVRVRLVKPQFKLDSRISFHEGQALSINGLDAGVILNEKLRFTLGYYGMEDRLKAFDETIEGEQFGRIIRLRYGSLNTEIIYKDMRFIGFGMPLELAAGMNTFMQKNISTEEVISTQSGALLFVNFGLSVTYKPMRFLGLKGILGYRKMVFNQVKNFRFDGFFTSIGLNMDIHEIVTDFKMFRLKKKYKRGNNIVNAVEIITN